MLYKGIPFNGGMDSPSGTGAQHIVQTCEALCDFLQEGGTPGTLFDTADLASVAWNGRALLDASGNQSVNWGIQEMVDGSNELSLDWGARVLVNHSGITTIDWDQAYLAAASQIAIDWGNRALKDSGSNTILSWDNTGEPVKITTSAATTIIDIDNTSGSGATGINWKVNGTTVATLRVGGGGFLLNTVGLNAQCSFGNINFFGGVPAGQQTGGAATAGIAYTSTEQTMLNKVYSAMRAYGLLT